MGFSDLPWSKIFATFFGVALAVVELWEYKRKRKSIRWKKRKKLISISLISGLLISTLWSDVSEESKNILQEKTRNDNIVKDSIRLGNLSKRTDVIVNNVGYTVQGVEDLKNTLLLMDSMVVVTNERLDLIDKKSKEAFKLDLARFNLGRPKINILNSFIKFVPDFVDSTKLNITFRITNPNPRTATNIKYDIVLIMFNTDPFIKNFYTIDRPEYSSMDDLLGNNQVESTATTLFRINKEEILSKYKHLIFIIRMKYNDESDNQEYDENFFFEGLRLTKGYPRFGQLSEPRKKWISQFLMEYKMHRYLADSTIKKYN